MNQRQQNEQQHATHPEPGEHSEHNSDNGAHDGNSSGHHEAKMYLRFGLMIATSTVVMFGLTYTNAFSADHVRFSEERVYMALLMGAAMALIMLAFMWGPGRTSSRSSTWTSELGPRRVHPRGARPPSEGPGPTRYGSRRWHRLGPASRTSGRAARMR